ncbi:MAG: SMC-Scp complex subunit ScpB [Halieaceae bacterium]|jgi:segregation and condensation protein B|nr:SMC-Scp complex subunit ScpB [Halieaceae bacterium]
MTEIGLLQIVEGALLAAGKPLTVAQLGELFEDVERPDNAAIRAALEEAAQRCEGRGFELQEVASGFRYQVRQGLSPWVARLWQERPQKYSRALLETLALIAYRQPITRGEIEEIRGVAVSSNIIKTLHEREWIRVVGHRDVPGRPAMYATTRQFLDYFNLKTLDQLPALADIRDLETLNAELGFSDPDPGTGQAEAASAVARGLTLVGGTQHLPREQTAEQPAAAIGQEETRSGEDDSRDARLDSGPGDDTLAERETTVMDLAATAAELVDDDANMPEADDESAHGADACDLADDDADSAAAGPDSRS